MGGLELCFANSLKVRLASKLSIALEIDYFLIATCQGSDYRISVGKLKRLYSLSKGIFYSPSPSFLAPDTATTIRIEAMQMAFLIADYQG